jgi:predicted regulator of Ras-like GTPase activity (Roadblock/LC7/MglB family)
MAVGESDGIVIDAVLQADSRADTVAALVASLYRRTRLATAAAGLGSSGLLHLEAESGSIFAAGRGDVVLVAMAEGRINTGLIRVELLRESRAGA